MRVADKLTLGQNLNVIALHSVAILMGSRGHHQLTHAQMTQYQRLICENPLVKLEVVLTVNPATFLTDKAGPLDHDCLEILDALFSSTLDLTDKPLHNPELVLYTDGCSFLEKRKRMARYAVVSDSEVVEAEALPQGWSAQKVEL